MKLECEKEHQEQLLLSVIPAYIAAEVKILLYFSQFGLQAHLVEIFGAKQTILAKETVCVFWSF